MKNTKLLTLSAATGLFVASFSAAAHEPPTTGAGTTQQVAMQQDDNKQKEGENWDASRPLSPQVRQGQASDFPKGEMKNMEPAVPVGPGVVPGVVPVIPLERLQGVETVTLDTPQGPVVVISWPVSGNVTTSEYNVNFSAMDTNRDGYISREETSAMAGRSKAARQLSQNFDMGDANSDGRLSMSEVIDWIY